MFITVTYKLHTLHEAPHLDQTSDMTTASAIPFSTNCKPIDQLSAFAGFFQKMDDVRIEARLTHGHGDTVTNRAEDPQVEDPLYAAHPSVTHLSVPWYKDHNYVL